MRLVVLYGPDEMGKREKLHELRDALQEAHGEVETFSFDGKTVGLADVFDELRSYSLMQTYKLVVVDEADPFVKTHREALERYADSPVDTATLLLRPNTWHRGKLDKGIEKIGAIIKCDPMSPSDAKNWLTKRAREVHGRKLAPAAAEALISRLGTDMMRLDSEVAKLALMVDEKASIEASLVEQVVGRSNEEHSWVVQDAILQGLSRGSAKGAIAKIHELVDLGGQPEVLVTYFVADLVRKLNVGLMLKRSGEAEGQIAKQFKFWGPKQKPFIDVLRRIDGRKAGRFFDQLMQADAGAKSGLGTSMRNLECVCVRLAAAMK